MCKNNPAIIRFEDGMWIIVSMKDLGHLMYILGLEVTPTATAIFLSQYKYKYTGDFINMAWVINAKTFDTPIELNVKYSKNNGETVSDLDSLQEVGWLSYLSYHDSIGYFLSIWFRLQPVYVWPTTSALESCSHNSLSTWHLQVWTVVSKGLVFTTYCLCWCWLGS